MLLTILIVLLPILFQFKSPVSFITFGEFLLIPVIIWEIIKKIFIKKDILKFKVPTGLLVFYCVPIITTFFASFSPFYSFGESLTVILRIVFYFVLIILAIDSFNSTRGIKIYLAISTIMSFYLFLQVLFYYASGVFLPTLFDCPQILFVKTEIFSTPWYYHMFGFRPSSLFTEPSYFANFISPAIIIVLFSKEKLPAFMLKKMIRISLAIFFTLCIVLSTSSLGIVYCLAIWIFFFISPSSTKLFGWRFKIVCLSGFATIVLASLGMEIFKTAIERLLKGASIGQRVFRGFIIFSYMDIYQKIFGVGLNNVGNFVAFKGIVTPYDEANLNYTVTLTNRLIATGLIGTTSLIWFCFINFKSHKTALCRGLLVLVFLSFIFANGEYTFTLPFFVILLNCFETRLTSFSSAKRRHSIEYYLVDI